MVTKSEIIKNDIFRYNFIGKYMEGKILDYNPNKLTLGPPKNVWGACF